MIRIGKKGKKVEICVNERCRKAKPRVLKELLEEISKALSKKADEIERKTEEKIAAAAEEFIEMFKHRRHKKDSVVETLNLVTRRLFGGFPEPRRRDVITFEEDKICVDDYCIETSREEYKKIRSILKHVLTFKEEDWVEEEYSYLSEYIDLYVSNMKYSIETLKALSNEEEKMKIFRNVEEILTEYEKTF